MFAAVRTGKDLNGPKKQRKHLARIQAFTEASLHATALDGSPLLLALVRKLQVMEGTYHICWVCGSSRRRAASIEFTSLRQHGCAKQHAVSVASLSLLVYVV